MKLSDEQRAAMRERAQCAYHQHREWHGACTVECLSAFIADQLADLVDRGSTDGRCDGCRELGVPKRGDR